METFYEITFANSTLYGTLFHVLDAVRNRFP